MTGNTIPDESTVKNYCPISLLCSISKVLEWLLYFNNVYIEFLISAQTLFHVISLNSTNTLRQLLLYCVQAKGKLTVFTLINFHKVFDSVLHSQPLGLLAS